MNLLTEDGMTVTPIYNVQGSGRVSPLEGDTVTIEGVVTGDYQNGGDPLRNLNGFYIQEETEDRRPRTSEGIFIYEAPLITDVNVGDKVRVTGVVREFLDEVPRENVERETQVVATEIEVIGSGSIEPISVDLPTLSVIDPGEGRLIADLEQYEGMLVTFPETLTVTDTFNLGRFGNVNLSQDGRLFQFTNSNTPSRAGFARYSRDIASRTILLDDDLILQNPNPIIYPSPQLSSTNTVRGGDEVNGLTGNVRFGAGGFNRPSSGTNAGLQQAQGDWIYRIIPSETPEFEVVNPRPQTPDPVGGDLKVGIFNVENLFTTLNVNSSAGTGPENALRPRGATNATELDRQLERLVTTIDLLDADVLGLAEIENNGYGTVTAGNPQAERSAIAALVEELNEVSDSTYAFVDPGVDFLGTDAIKVDFIYNTDTVQLAPGTEVVYLTDADLPALGDIGLSGDPIFDGFATSRVPVAATFQEISTGETFTATINHYKSKGASGLDSGDDENLGNPDPRNRDQLDGQGFWNFRRTEASIALDAWLETQPTGTDDSDVLILGDLNAYIEEDPLTELESRGYEALLRRINGSEPYSFVFRGQAGALDHAFSNPSLSEQVTGITEWHTNADEPSVLNYSLGFGRDPELFDGSLPFRSSDHDALLLGLNLASDAGGSEPNIINGTPRRDILVGTDGIDVITGFGQADILTGGLDNDIFVYTAVGDGQDRITDFEIGSDLIDLAGVLNSIGYTGTDPIADGVVGFVQRRNNAILNITFEGPLGGTRRSSLILFPDVDVATISDEANFIFAES
ncbi:ExeM/NucH family extracellular endonuclease [Gloeocapsa sp. PCC 73106]|uniref:ExeM/NucH family extracellular endonuclease n=1 Tax=Gloeocapsa sp. PCC 73106 TaxID=102232 RepID=UPI0002AC2E6B|nr:ExeM/NucH family extracellular endonuclease [Gloeocapsa sp. PCC 73106]ELR97446.1 putative extracellular nuclease [Gloeocapsa sp. PCC 73106]